jgi:hypothetical protein
MHKDFSHYIHFLKKPVNLATADTVTLMEAFKTQVEELGSSLKS